MAILNLHFDMRIGHTELNDGRAIPNLAFGTGSAFRGKDVYDTVTAALKAGFRHIDTAQAYHNEDSVGQAIKDWTKSESCLENSGDEEKLQSANERGQLWITTKYSGGPAGPYKELKSSLQRVRFLMNDWTVTERRASSNLTTSTFTSFTAPSSWKGN